MKSILIYLLSPILLLSFVMNSDNKITFIVSNEFGFLDSLKLDFQQKNGEYFGSIVIKNKTKIYYTATIDTFELEDSTIEFKLQKVLFNDSPFTNKIISFNVRNYDSIPYIYKHVLTFFGDLNIDSFYLNRTSPLYDSKADILFFRRKE